MANEMIMRGMYLGEDCGFSAYIIGIDSNVEYERIFFYLEEDENNTIDVNIDMYDTYSTECATFNGLELYRYYNVNARILYKDGNVKIISNRIFASETLMYQPMLMSSSESGSGGTPAGGEVAKPSVYTPLIGYKTITPVSVTIKNQHGYETCVACSLSTAMSIFGSKYSKFTESYSVAYIFGSDRRRNEEYMYFKEAIDKCITYGSPRWEIGTGILHDSMTKNDAYELFGELKNNSIIYNNALNQRFNKKEEVNFYNSARIYDIIKDLGYFMFNFKVPNNFYDVGSDGIVPQPDDISTFSYRSSSQYSGANHSMALVGFTYDKNGTPCWIAQNSWGQSWGKNGYCYIPCDWGYNSSEYWALDSYCIWPGSGYKENSHPNVPTNISVTTSYTSSEITVSWSASTTAGSSYLVLYWDGYKWNAVFDSYTRNTSVNIPKTDDVMAAEMFMVLAMNNYNCSKQPNYAYIKNGFLNPRITEIHQHMSCVKVEKINVDIDDVEYTSVLYIKESSEWIKCSSNTWFFDDYSPTYGNKYQFKIVITYFKDNNSVLEESNIIGLTLNELPNIELEDHMVIRLPKGFVTRWISPYVGEWKKLEMYDIKFYKGDNYSRFSVLGSDNESTNSSIFITVINEEDLINATEGSLYNFDYATTYQVQINYTAYLTTTISDDCRFVRNCPSLTSFSLTTSPAGPVITSATESDGVITVNWRLQDVNSNISQVYINVHDPDNVLVLNKTETSTYGSFTYSAVKDGQHKITMSSCYVVGNNPPIFAADEKGNQYYAIKYVYVGTQEIEKWVWKTAITTNSSISVTGNSIPIVSSDEWNNFTQRINDVRNALNMQNTVFTTAYPGVEFKQTYNEAVRAIKEIGYGNSLSEIVSGVTILHPNLFTALSTAINNAIDAIK